MVSLEVQVVHATHRFNHLQKSFTAFVWSKIISEEHYIIDGLPLTDLDTEYNKLGKAAISIMHQFKPHEDYFCLPTDGIFDHSNCFGKGGQPKEAILAELSCKCRDIKSKLEKLFRLQQTVSSFLRIADSTQELRIMKRMQNELRAMTQTENTSSKLSVGPDAVSLIRQIERTYKGAFGRKPPSVRLIQCNEGPLTKIISDYDELYSCMEEFQRFKDEQAATTIMCWWRRRQLELHYFRPHRAARVIQRQLRSYVSTKKNNAATKIQLWRRNIVRQRKERRLAAAAQSNPLRDRGLKLTKRNKSTRRRHKRLEQRQKRKVTGNKTALQNTSESSCRGSVIGKTLHNNQRGSSSRESVLGISMQHRSRNENSDSAPILDEKIEETLRSSGSSSSESVLGISLQPELQSSSSKTKSRKRRRRGRRRRHRRSLNKCILRNKNVAKESRNEPTPNHCVSSPDLLPMSTFCDRMRKQYQLATPSDRNVLLKSMCQLVIKSIDALSIEHSPIDKCIPPTYDENHSTSSNKCSSSELNQSPPTTLNEIQALSSNIKLDLLTPPSNTTTIVKQPPLTPAPNEEATNRRKMTYLQALTGKLKTG